MKHYTPRILALTLSAAMLLASCSGNPPAGSQAPDPVEQDTVLRYGISEGPATINPTNLGDIISYEMVRQCYNGLTDREPDGTLKPGLAESWTLENDGMSYRFKLREGVRFHSGNELKASDVKFTFEYDLSPDRSSSSASYLTEIVGAQAMLDGTAQELEGFEIVNDYEFVIHFTQPVVYFPEYCSVESLYIVEQAEVEGAGEDWWMDQSAGTGPYSLQEYTEDEHVLMTANQNYWDGAPSIDGIEFVIVPEETTAFEMYKSGELDVITAPSAELSNIKADETLSQELVSYPMADNTYFGMNQSLYEPFQDIRVRQAISMVISQEDLSNKVFPDITNPLYGILPPDFNGANEERGAWTYDPEEARNLLSQAGYDASNPLPPLEIYCMGYNEDTAVYMQSQLQTELGMTVTISPCDRATLLDVLGNQQGQSYIFGSTAAYGDPRALIQPAFNTGAGRNFSGYSNPEFDALMDETAQMTDVEARTALYQQAEQLLIDDCAFVPLYVDMNLLLVKPYVTNMKLSGLGMDILDTVELNRA